MSNPKLSNVADEGEYFYCHLRYELEDLCIQKEAVAHEASSILLPSVGGI